MNENERNWYPATEEKSEAEWYSAAADLRREQSATSAKDSRKKERRKTALCAILATLLILAAAAGVTYAIVRGVEKKTETSEKEDTLPDPKDVPDYKKYFEEYFSPISNAEKSKIKQIENFPNLVLKLSPAGEEEFSYREIYEKCAPSIVTVRCFPKEDSEDEYYLGSGIIFSQDGFILTNSHLVEGNCRAQVVLNTDEEFEALLVGNDPSTDLAILKIDARGLCPAEFGDGESLAVGDGVVAIGNPLAETFRSSMTEGIISGIDRDIESNGMRMTMLQTSTPINEGNSGGALINMHGQVIGITNMKMSNWYYGEATIEGVALAIPIKVIKPVADALLSAGTVSRPALGLVVGPIPSSAKSYYDLPDGLYVSEVREGSDCEAKGIQTGDIILKVNGEAVLSTEDITDRIDGLTIGDSLSFEIWRDGEVYSVTVLLVSRDKIY